jgi:hypothetical protein
MNTEKERHENMAEHAEMKEEASNVNEDVTNEETSPSPGISTNRSATTTG